MVVRAVSIVDYQAMERAIESRGFKHDLSPEAPICRWVLDGAMLDLMPSEPGILGFHNRWYPLAVKTATRVRLPDGMEIPVIAAPLFVIYEWAGDYRQVNVSKGDLPFAAAARVAALMEQ